MSKRRNHDAAFKARVVLEALKGARTVSVNLWSSKHGGYDGRCRDNAAGFVGDGFAQGGEVPGCQGLATDAGLGFGA